MSSAAIPTATTQSPRIRLRIACVSRGSAASATDDAPWQVAFNAWLKPKLQPDGCPVLGLCYGHQLIARLLYAHDIISKRQLFKPKSPKTQLSDRMFCFWLNKRGYGRQRVA